MGGGVTLDPDVTLQHRGESCTVLWRNMLGIDGGALQTSFNCFTGQILLHFDINNILLAQIQQI